jgi:hypothetical protein
MGCPLLITYANEQKLQIFQSTVAFGPTPVVLSVYNPGIQAISMYPNGSSGHPTTHQNRFTEGGNSKKANMEKRVTQVYSNYVPSDSGGLALLVAEGA